MHLFATNLKFLRRKYSWSQQVLADKLNMGRSTIADYERSKSEPSFTLLIQLAEVCQVSVDDLLTKDLLHESYQIIKNRNMKVLVVSVDKDDNEGVELVSKKAGAGYLMGYSDPEFIAELPKIQVPKLPKKTLRGFEIAGFSMLPIEPGSIIIASYLEDYEHIDKKRPHIIVTKNEGIVFKHIQDKGVDIQAISSNSEYSAYSIPKSEILELWQYEAYFSFVYPELNTIGRLEKKMDVLLEKLSVD